MGLRSSLLLGTYNAVSQIAWVGVKTLTRAGLAGSQWRLEQRTGLYDVGQGPRKETGRHGPVVWIHAASVGEARAAGALASALSKQMPHSRVVLSVLTTTGVDSARKKIPDIETIVHAPVDLKGPVGRALSWFNPSLVLLVETEIWPNMILESVRHGAAIAVVSGKISRNSYKRYRLVRPLMKHVLSALTCVGAQTEDDRSRFCGLGLDPARVRVTGDIKLDAELPEQPPPAPAWLPEILGKGHRWLFCAGSTRPGEEEAVARGALIAAEKLGKGLTVIVAPRHVQRAGAVCLSLRNLGFEVERRTTLTLNGWGAGRWPRALVLDTIGELGGVYPQCDVAFVGGTLAPYGGHNLAEPAAVGVPVLFGPHVDKTFATAQSLMKSGGGLMISGAEELGASLVGLLSDPSERARRGACAREAIVSLQGATDRTLRFLRESGALPVR